MKHCAIIFLLLVVPVAIRCEPLIFGGGGSGGVANSVGTTNPFAGLITSYLNYLTGTNGPLNGQSGPSNLVTQLLNNLIGPKGALTGLITGAGKNAGVVQNLITTVLNLLIGPNGLLPALLGSCGHLNGGGTNVISGLFNTLLGPTGLAATLLGPHGLLGGLLGGGVGLDLDTLLNSLLGQNGLLSELTKPIVTCLLGSGGGLLSGILGPHGLLSGLLGGLTGGNTNLSSTINTAMCQLQGLFPGQDLSAVESNCLSQVTTSDLASAIQSFLSNPTSCSASVNAGSLLSVDPNLLSFINCVATGMTNPAG